MRLFFDNLIDAQGVVFTASTYDISFPPANIAHEHRTNPWVTGKTVAPEWIVIDLLSAKAVTAVILIDHTLTAGDTLIKLEGNATNSWGAPSFSTTLTWASGVISKVFGSQSFRYWRISFTKSAAGEAREIGRVFIGTYYTTPDGPTKDGFEEEPQDLSTSARAQGGATYSDEQDSFRTISLAFEAISTTQQTAFEAFADAVKTHTSFFLQADENAGAGTKFAEVIYAKLGRIPRYVPNGWHADGSNAWNVTLEMEEQL